MRNLEQHYIATTRNVLLYTQFPCRWAEPMFWGKRICARSLYIVKICSRFVRLLIYGYNMFGAKLFLFCIYAVMKCGAVIMYRVLRAHYICVLVDCLIVNAHKITIPLKHMLDFFKMNHYQYNQLSQKRVMASDMWWVHSTIIAIIYFYSIPY